MKKNTFKRGVAVLAATTLIATSGLTVSANSQAKKEDTFSFPQQSLIIQKINEKLGLFSKESKMTVQLGPWKLYFLSGQFSLEYAQPAAPTAQPTKAPTAAPTAQPTKAPTAAPTAQPTKAPTAAPTAQPTKAPTAAPTAQPTKAPTAAPTAQPTKAPTAAPTAQPTKAPTAAPTAQPTQAPTAKPSTNPVVATEAQQEILSLVNKERAAAGLSALELDTKLNEVATEKARDMAVNNYFSHTSPTYGSPFDMLSEFGVSYRTAGENIAYGQTSEEQVMNDWMNSPGHRANILNANYTKLGVGYVQGKWVQLFIG
ncbi:CAP domain-containing protein [Paenibacillus camelliae]|uniref:CAP domain-containing protein n=1 Tax=Paenibacillus camelliae TaxID=512410 RepID=UPI00203BEBB0|nr:PT domain-containing protein [Paenibacillus camelliae]MCM3635138.1 PT domain-containing protein [Paenibacillus camelliae]